MQTLEHELHCELLSNNVSTQIPLADPKLQ